MSDARIQGYARALFEIARAEGTLDEVEDELFRFARPYESSESLRHALTDDQIPAEKRQAIITQAVTQGLDPSAPTKPSGISGIGEVPAHWTAKPKIGRAHV